MNNEEFNQFMVANVATMRSELISLLTNDTRNIDYECKYPPDLNIEHYQTVFNRQGIGKRIVEIFPEECWNSTPEVIEDSESKETKFESAWKDLQEQHGIWDYMYRLDVLSGIGQYGILLIGLNDGQKLDTEVTKKKCELLYLKPFSQACVKIKAKENDASSPRYGQPTMYSIRMENTDGTLSAVETDIHWSRVIHVADNRSSSDIFGVPRMQAVYNRLIDIRKIMGGSAEMFWKGGFPGYAFEISPERKTALTTDEKTAIREEFFKYSEGLQRYLAISGLTAKSLSPQVANPKSHFEVQLQYIGITLGIPYRLLIGAEQAKLASTQDSKTWNRRVAKRCKGHCNNSIIRPFINLLIKYGVLPEAKYTTDWPSLDELDEKDAAIIAKDKTTALAQYISSGAEAIMPPQQYLTMILNFSDEEAEGILKDAEKWSDDTLDENRPDEDVDLEKDVLESDE